MRYSISLFLILSFFVSCNQIAKNKYSQFLNNNKKSESKSTEKKTTKSTRKKALNPRDMRKYITLVVAGSGNKISIGNGFFITENLLVTNSHVVKNAVIRDGYKRTLINTDDNITDVGLVVVEDKANDLAIIKTVKQHKALKLEPNKKIKIGQEIFVFGHSPHFFSDLYEGVISKKDKNGEFLHIKSAISQKSSGFPVLSKDLKMIAVTVSVSKAGQNIDIAIPVAYLKSLIKNKEQALTEINKINLEKEVKNADRQYKKTISGYKKIAKAGNTKAQFILGTMYYFGRAVSQSYKKALYWYKKSALQGNASAQFILGTMYYTGEGVTQNRKQALYWYKKSALQEDWSAQIFLTVAYLSSQNLIFAYAWTNAIANNVHLIGSNKSKKYLKIRDSILKELSPEQIIQAKHYSSQIAQEIASQRQIASK